MRTLVMHQPRVAWDLALTTVAMAGAGAEQRRWFASQLEQRFGAGMLLEFQDTRARLLRADRLDGHALELGRWRVRIEDLLIEDPGLAEDLTLLRLDANARLASA